MYSIITSWGACIFYFFKIDVKFNGKVALVTGAGKGLGKAISLGLAAGGATVHGIARTQKDLDSLKQEASGIHVHQADITDWDKTRELVKKIGAVDLLVNNAGTVKNDDFITCPKEQLDSTIALNISALFNVSQVVAQSMIDAGKGGSIVNMSSDAADVPIHMHSVYCMTKGAVDSLTRCMALELGKHKINVNSVQASGVKTPLLQGIFENLARESEEKQKLVTSRLRSALDRRSVLEVGDVVNAVLFLLSDKADMITGSIITVDKGMKIA